eukprot:scaffold2859_cov349-Pavlova_lutheri.AAC.71
MHPSRRVVDPKRTSHFPFARRDLVLRVGKFRSLDHVLGLPRHSRRLIPGLTSSIVWWGGRDEHIDPGFVSGCSTPLFEVRGQGTVPLRVDRSSAPPSIDVPMKPPFRAESRRGLLPFLRRPTPPRCSRDPPSPPFPGY